jgi:hypothetical protein
MSLNIDRLANAVPIYAGASRDVAHRPADDHHGGSSILSQTSLLAQTSTSDTSVKKKKKTPKATFDWKQGTEKFVKKAIILLSEVQDESEVETWLKKKTGASVFDLYQDMEYLCLALETPDLFDKILEKGIYNTIYCLFNNKQI